MVKKRKKLSKLLIKKLSSSLNINLFLILFASAFVGFWHFKSGEEINYKIFLLSLSIGFFAQIIDGALGMAYGVISTSLLMFNSVPPALASGAVHIAEIFTTASSGVNHWKVGNINKKLLQSLIFPGIVGGVAGVFFITTIDASIVRPWISGYLVIMGCYIFAKAFGKKIFQTIIKRKKIVPLAFFGGFIDSIGGGGWGPVVTSTLLGSGHEPKKTIGSVNSAEFFITMVTGFSFALLIGISNWEVVGGLIFGGLIASPIAVRISTKLPTKFLMIFVGLVIISVSLINLIKSL
jgi:hypothetical protein